ncbi:ABC transporter substrate-binding protein [Burkholderia multivorans]|uniref:ABC transporter substrate-binding protein n=1 Tax=Burkholderia multivorans TaxID=87883 RepID=UPI001C22AA40|nr:ABC transporter substrate-binding protein [Burkholderia multivorans]MBU9284131.1 ABC transporter substrate-binding protein [Burkholderia multivorans]
MASSLDFLRTRLAAVLLSLAAMTGPVHADVAADVAQLPGVMANPKLAAMLPRSIRATGVLNVATDLTPPISFHAEDGKLIGIDADLAAALGVILRVQVRMTDVGAGAAIVPSIKAHRFDLSLSGINDDTELQKQLDVIDYMYDATTVMTPAGNPLHIARVEDLCGRMVAVPVGTFQERLVESVSGKCSIPIRILTLPKMPDVLQAVRTGRADATVNGYATSVYTTQHQTGVGRALQALPAIRMEVGYLGMLVPKDVPRLRDALAAALQQMVDSGAYSAILRKWGLGSLAVKTVELNRAQHVAAN